MVKSQPRRGRRGPEDTSVEPLDIPTDDYVMALNIEFREKYRVRAVIYQREAAPFILRNRDLWKKVFILLPKEQDDAVPPVLRR
ncbi:MAG TPA: hypothetical protein VM050_07205 [Patescibacteria group bacterium]|nr:hypothetical protein [Patescibacteria group bacterium]